MASMLAATLSAGDAVLVRVNDGAGYDAILDGVVVRPMQIGADGDATVKVQLQRSGRPGELREVGANALLLPQRRVAPKRKLGEDDGWAEGPARAWRSAARDANAVEEEAVEVRAPRAAHAASCWTYARVHVVRLAVLAHGAA